MSAFLGPIHYWMFGKIKTMESRAFAIAAALEAAGVKRDETAAAIAGYGEKLEGQDLAQIIGDNSIHQYLYGLISKTQVFEASLVEIAGDRFDIVMKAASDHGRATAAAALKEKGQKADSIESIYRYVSDYQLEGMPCDPGAEVSQSGGSQIKYLHRTCNHIQNWEYTNVELGKMCAMTNEWLKGFISGLNENGEYTVSTAIALGASSCEAEISLKA